MMAYITLSLVTTVTVMKRHLHRVKVHDINVGKLQGDKEQQQEVGVKDMEQAE